MSYPEFLDKLVSEALARPAFAYQGVRKILNGLTVDTPFLPVLNFSELGYGSNKFKQLQRNYVNEEEFARVRTILDRRHDQSFTSVALSMRGKPKDARSQGHCILSVVVTRSQKEERVEVQYRSTELVLKFGGDLCFIPWILDEIGADPNHLTFRFANCYLSGVYFPYVAKFLNPVEFLQRVKKKDPRLFEQGTRFFLRSSYKEDQVFPYSPENVAHRFGWKALGKKGMKDVQDYLESEHKKFGKPLPKLHYKEGEYIPRGKRAATRETEGENE